MTEPRVEFHPDAIAETRAAREWYAARSPRAAQAFLLELDHAIGQIALCPERWPRHVHGTRRYVLRRFPFSLVYRHSGAALVVIAVVHAKRKPGYWATR